MRKGSSTVVSIVGTTGPGLLDSVGSFPNVVAVEVEGESLAASIGALGRAEHLSSPFVVLAADPLSELATAWRDMWSGEGAQGFEEAAGEILREWRAGRFQLPDFYVVVASQPDDLQDSEVAPQRDDFHLGFLGSQRPSRVVTVVASDELREDCARVTRALSGLPQGPWWPDLNTLIDAARGFFPGVLVDARS